MSKFASRFVSAQVGVFLIAFLAGCFALGLGRSRFGEARAEEGFQAGYQLVTTAGVVSSNGTTSATVLTFPNGYAAPATHRFWVGGITIFNTDTASHTPSLVSHYSRRVMWCCPLPAGSGVILDNVNMLASDAGTTAHPEGVDLILENGGGNKVGVVGQGYYK